MAGLRTLAGVMSFFFLEKVRGPGRGVGAAPGFFLVMVALARGSEGVLEKGAVAAAFELGEGIDLGRRELDESRCRQRKHMG